MEALVSIVTAVYKAEDYLEQCIQSILGQSYRNLELILVDDGSPDDCPAICDRYAQQDSRVKVIHQTNQGAITARNVGIHTASGQYIMFVDSDDWVDSGLVEKVMAQAPFSLALFGCTQTSANGGILNVTLATDTPRTFAIDDERDLMKTLLMNSLLGYACNKIYSREIIGDIAFAPWRDREDLTFNLKVFQRVAQLAISDEVGYYYRQHSGSSLHVTYNCPVPNYIETARTIFKDFSGWTMKNRKEMSNIAVKAYLLDAIHRYIKHNAYLTEKDRKKEIRKLFADKELREHLSLGYNTCRQQKFFSLCFVLRLSSIYYYLGVS